MTSFWTRLLVKENLVVCAGLYSQGKLVQLYTRTITTCQGKLFERNLFIVHTSKESYQGGGGGGVFDIGQRCVMRCLVRFHVVPTYLIFFLYLQWSACLPFVRKCAEWTLSLSDFCLVWRRWMWHIKRSVLRRQSRDTNRNVKRSVYCRFNVSSVGPSSERNWIGA